MTGGARNRAIETPPRRGRPVTLSAEARRTRLFDALEGVFRDSGLEGATMAAIARRAGMSKRTVYDLFPGRNALLRGYLDRARGDFVRPLSEAERALPLEERLRRLFPANRRPGGYGLPLEILRLTIAEVAAAPDVGCQLVARFAAESLAAVAEQIELGVARGEVSVEDPRAAAALLVDMIRPGPLESLLDPSHLPDAASLSARRDLAIRVFLDGVAAKRT